MKKKQKFSVKIGLILLFVAALILVVAPYQAMAKDTDGDGFTDAEEEALEFELPTYLIPAGQEPIILDPEAPDLFVILEPPAEGSNLDGFFDPFKYVREFGINVHHLFVAYPNMCSPENYDCRDLDTELGQKAIMATEDLGPSSMLGKCEEEWCTPNAGLDGVVVWTQAIKNFIASKCGNKTCVDKSTGATYEGNPLENLNLENLYIQQTFAHEIGHDTKLRSINDPKVGGFHYSAKEGVTMSQYMTYREGKSSITWNIATDYARDDLKDANLYDAQAQ